MTIDDWLDDVPTLNDIRNKIAQAQAFVPQQPTITMKHFPKHRAHPGWWAVDWGNEFFFPKAEIDKWIFDNCSGVWDYCEVTQSRRFFEDEADALLCYMAFKA